MATCGGAVAVYDGALAIQERLVNAEGRRELANDLAQLIATILDPATIRAILRAMGVAPEAADRAPPGVRGG